MAESSADKTASGPTGVNMRKGDLIAHKYRVLSDLGYGASGTVHLCEHIALEKRFAVKVLHRDLADNPGVVERFQREARVAAQLDHPNSVRVTDFGQDDSGTLYLAMEYVPGRDLAELLNHEWPLSDDRIVHIMKCVLSALSAAHALGIVHRDLKPENILVQPATAAHTGDTIKVCDFGIAQLSPNQTPERNVPGKPSSRRLTGDGMIVGTCAYMSPEQSRASQLDARSDLYSAGVVLFQMLTRTVPFVSDNPMAVAVMHCTTPPPPPSGYCSVHPGLEAVCLKALSKTPELRYQSATEMLAALDSAVAMVVASRVLGRRPRPSLAPLPAPARLNAAREASSSVAPTELPGRAAPPKRARAGTKRKTALLMAAVSLILVTIAATPSLVARTRRLQAQLRQAGAPAASVSTPEARADRDVPIEQTVAEIGRIAPPTAATDNNHRLPLLAATAHPAREQRQPTVRPHRSAPSTAENLEVQPSPMPARANTDDTAAAQARAASEGALQPQAPDTVVAAAPAAAERPAPVAESLPPSIQLANTRLSMQLDKVRGGASKASVRAAIAQSAVARCFQPSPWRDTAMLEVSTNMTGRIVDARVSDANMPKLMRECIEQVARNGQIRDADVGEVHATFSLTPEP